MRITFLGTGTSTGVPQIGCDCEVCRSVDPRDNRLRTSALVEVGGESLLIDCGPDFRQQLLRIDSYPVTALLVTHHHYDHLGGIDDLRPYCAVDKPFPIYCNNFVAQRIHTLMPYCFGPERYPGSPIIELNVVEDGVSFKIGQEQIEVTPLSIFHTDTLEILGFKIGPLTYITDCKLMPDATLEAIADSTDTLIINALRHEEHRSHLNLSQALDVIKLVKPRQAFLTHMSHQMGLHASIDPTLPDNVRLAYDGLTVEL